MAVTLTTSARFTPNADTALPTHAVGNLLVIVAWRSVNGPMTKPSASGTIPAWVTIDAPTGTNTYTLISCYFVATANNHTSGVWTGASGAICAVLTGHNSGSPIGDHKLATAASGTPTAPAITPTVSDGSSAFLSFFGVGGASGATWPTAPSGYTRQANGTVSTNTCCLDTKDSTTSDGSVAHTPTAGGVYYTTQMEIVAAATSPTLASYNYSTAVVQRASSW